MHGVLGWLRLLLLSLLIAAPGMARAMMVNCPTMAAAVVAPEPEDCHSMGGNTASDDLVAADPAPGDSAPAECCGSACAPAVAVIADRLELRAVPVVAEPGAMIIVSLASIARLPEKPPPRT